MKNLLLIIDCQKAFINKYTEKYIEKINNLIKNCNYDDIICTKFKNSGQTPFYNLLNYRKCLNDNDCKLVIDTETRILEKETYSAVNYKLMEYLLKSDINEVYLCGFDTDGCVLKTALDLFENNVKTYILQDYCMSSGGELYHDAAIKILKRSIGDKYII